jgi:hypothetical protein
MQSTTTIQTAHREYARRPKDETFPSLQALIDNAGQDKARCGDKAYNLRDLTARVIVTDAGHEEVRLASPNGQAKFTHWSFGQTCRMVGAPAGYLRDLPADLIARNLNHGLHDAAPIGTTANVLIRAPHAGSPEPTIRACTSDTYGRAWDHDLYANVQRMFLREQPGHTDNWRLPMTWSGEPGGAYRGDRDSFLIVVNGGSIVEDPTLTNRAGSNPHGSASPEMFRGVMVRNSEVGASSVTIETVLFRYICGNLMLWGAVLDRRFRRRHVGKAVVRDVVRELATIARQWSERPESADQQIIRALIDHEIAATRDAVIDELRAIGATKEQAERAYELAEQHEPTSPRSFWGAAQGLTRASQESDYQDGRYELDKLAAIVLARGAKKYAIAG